MDLWIFAHRYELPYLKQRCLISIPVQTAFLETVVEDRGVERFLKERVSLEGVEEMMNAICESTSSDARKKLEKECIARERLQSLVDSVYERE